MTYTSHGSQGWRAKCRCEVCSEWHEHSKRIRRRNYAREAELAGRPYSPATRADDGMNELVPTLTDGIIRWVKA